MKGSNEEYLQYIVDEILPKVKEENLAKRVDIFIEKSAFQTRRKPKIFRRSKELGFEITVHADQFTAGSSRIAVEVGAVSADHLEATIDEDIEFWHNSETVAVGTSWCKFRFGEPLPQRENFRQKRNSRYCK